MARLYSIGFSMLKTAFFKFHNSIWQFQPIFSNDAIS